MPQDYDKIFASGATSTQDWADENYLRGWGYLGQTPPPYQLFDALFKRLDLKTQELKSGQDNISSNYVPLAGGVMTGLLSLFTGSTVSTPSSDDNSKKIPNTEWVQDYIDNFLVGNIIYRAFLQNGYVKLNGATVQREDYPRLVQYATTNSLFTADNTTTPWLFGNGDGEITFVLPDYRNLFIEGGDTPSKIEAGLPNITGIFFDLITNVSGKMGNGTGCFNTLPESVESGISTINSNAFTNTGATKDGISLDASRSSSIYGASTTVQPPAIILIPQIKY